MVPTEKRGGARLREGLAVVVMHCSGQREEGPPSIQEIRYPFSLTQQAFRGRFAFRDDT